MNTSNLSKFKLNMSLRCSGLSPTDVVLASFPKSGNTWVRFMLANLYVRLNGNSESRVNAFNIARFSPELPGWIGSELKAGVMPRIVKTHLAYNHQFRQVILLVRDPVSVMRSYYTYAVARKLIGNNVALSQFIQSEKYGIPAWKRHTMSYIMRSELCFEVQIFDFASIKNSPLEFLDKAAEILGLPRQPEVIKEVVQVTSLQRLKESEDFLAKHTLQTDDFRFFGGTCHSALTLNTTDIDFVRLHTEELCERLGITSVHA